ncbi:MAG: leucine-rich repeat protein [Muribaculaceae bacterium]|nr:leucine-rich repeat protein [Muribaculaceae bacterium]
MTTLNVPETVENGGVTYTVTAIGDQAFRWSSVVTATLPATIDTLRHGAFNSSDLVSITLNDGLKYIGEYALSCKKMPSIDIPGSVEVIDGSAFFAASQLANVTFHDGLKKIGKSAFYNTALTSVVIPATVDTIGATSFLFCRKLASVTINEGSLKYVGDGAFNGCVLLESMQLPSTVEYIGLEAFLDDSKLSQLNIPASVTKLGESFMAKTAIANINLDPANKNYKLVDGVLYNTDGNLLIAVPMKGLTELAIPAQVQGIYSGAFWGSEVANVELPDGLVIIDDYAFCQSALASIEFPPTLIWVGVQAFAATKLTEVTLPENFPYINDGEFAGCTQLAKVVIPSSVMEVYPHAFNNCSKATFYANGSMAPEIMDYYEDYDHPFYGTGGYVYVPKGAKSSYVGAGWNDQLTVREKELGTFEITGCNPAYGDEIVVEGGKTKPSFAFYFDRPVQVLDEHPRAFLRLKSFVSSSVVTSDKEWEVAIEDDGYTLIVSRDEEFTVEDGIEYYFTLPEGIVSNDDGELNEHYVVACTFRTDEAGVAGDVTGDGKVDVEDVNAAINIILELSELDLKADLNGDGKVDVEDVNAIINIILEL